MAKRSDLPRGLVAAVMGGAAGLLAMRLYWQGAKAVSGKDPRTETRPEGGSLHDVSIVGKQKREGESSTEAAGRLADESITGGPPSSSEKKRKLSQAVHQGFGLTMAGTYVLLRGRVPPPDLIGGLAFGTGVWALADELLVPVLGLSRGPTAYPLRQHAHRLGAHLAYGIATSSAAQVANRAFDGRRTRRERIWSTARDYMRRHSMKNGLNRVRGVLARAS